MWGDNNQYFPQPCLKGLRIMCDSWSQGRENWFDKVFKGLPVGADEAGLFARFLDAHDFAPNSRRAMSQDMRKFVRWFTAVNAEPFRAARGDHEGRHRLQDPSSAKPGAGGGDGQQGVGDPSPLLRLARGRGPCPRQPGQAGEGTSQGSPCAEGAGSECGQTSVARD